MAHVSSSGIQAFGNWKLKGGNKFIQYELHNGEINVSKYGSEQMEWNQFVNQLPKDHPCWTFYHFKYDTKTGGQRSKLCLIQWIPEDSAPRDKMSYAMWTNVVKTSLEGVHCIIQACDIADVEYTEVLSRVSKFERDQI